MDARDPDLKKELDAALQTRKELGAEYESELVDSFMEKVEQRFDDAADRQVRRRLAEQQMATARGARPYATGAQPDQAHGLGLGERFAFVGVSLVLAIPLSAIGVVNAGLPGLLVTWSGIFGVNAVHAAGALSWLRRSRASDGEQTPRVPGSSGDTAQR
ncbi:hypothetical protein AB0B12_34370 [Streptomyces sp. NPDC044780]|uniref:Integral membrane protein n=1 Tax=Streptomyces luomodiensis TaxID=3026192 RepID=A0ABY9UYU6_9ACTN|nr:hypothetical protein [Streptomyces sp. SCA4-21]WNE97019.1 hypothetical protein PS467_17615 [Streptomyces sp. SCA4-21]